MTGTATVRRAVHKAHGSQSADKGARLGFLATAFMHGVVAVLVVLVALGDRGQQADQAGALRVLASQPLGRGLILVVALGFAGYAGWRALEAAVGRRDCDGAERLAKRATSAALAVGYAVLAAGALRVALGGGTSDPERQGDSLTRSALQLPGGRVLVGLVALAVVAVGVGMAVYGLRGQFREHLYDELDGPHEGVVVVLGAVGWAARGALVVLVGGFLGKAALQRDPEEARGLDGALRALAEQPAGRGLLLAVAAGLVAYGLFNLAQARWRRTRT